MMVRLFVYFVATFYSKLFAKWVFMIFVRNNMHNVKQILCGLALIALFSSAPAMADIQKIECHYDKKVEYVDGSLQMEDVDYTILIELEDNSNQAKMNYLDKTTTAEVFDRDGGVVLIEKIELGNSVVTTISEDLYSVQGANILAFGSLLSDQYYGQCQLK